MQVFFKLALLTVLAVTLLPAQEGGGKTDQELMEGRWKISSAKTGNPKTEEFYHGHLLDFSKGKLRFLNAAREQEEVVVIKLRPDRTPKEIDMYPVGSEEAEPLVGIYSLDNGKLKLCWSKNEGRDRPTDFAIRKGRGRHVLLVLEREK